LTAPHRFKSCRLRQNRSMEQTFPAAEGARLPWTSLPRHVVDAIERALGARIEEAIDQPGGFSPGAAARLRLVDGRRVFVKAVGSELNPHSPSMHRAEAQVVAALPSDAPVPRLLFSVDDGDWVAVGFEDVDGRHPRLPWIREDLDRVLAAVANLSETLTPSPLDVPSIAKLFARVFVNWRSLAKGSSPVPAELDPWAVRNVRRLAELEAAWPAASRGDTLLHSDLRADNILLTDDRVFFIDWPSACVGAPWIDLMAMLPSVAMQHGPRPEELFDAHPVARGASAEDVDAALATIAGYFVLQAFRPPPPGLPTVREFQRAQGVHALAWLRRRVGWD
jgi:hypothetical protein